MDRSRCSRVEVAGKEEDRRKENFKSVEALARRDSREGGKNRGVIEYALNGWRIHVRFDAYQTICVDFDAGCKPSLIIHIHIPMSVDWRERCLG